MRMIDLERKAIPGPAVYRAAARSAGHGDGPLTIHMTALHAELPNRGIAAALADEPDGFRPRLPSAVEGQHDSALPWGA